VSGRIRRLWGRREGGPPEGLVPAGEAVARARRQSAAPEPLDDARRELVARRERLTQRFALLQTDLGGAFYEMAIRDHVRLDALTRKAAELQRVDAELAAVERELLGASRQVAGECAACSTPYEEGARFCSSCGNGLAGVTLPAAVEQHVNGVEG
jgi:hypothetical protein